MGLIARLRKIYHLVIIHLLHVRRTKIRSVMYKIHYNMVPEYLQNIMPNIRSKESMYVTRQSQNYNIPKSRLNIYKSSFVPKATDEWNAILLEIRQCSTLASFQNSLNTLKPTRPLYFSYGELLEHNTYQTKT